MPVNPIIPIMTKIRVDDNFMISTSYESAFVGVDSSKGEISSNLYKRKGA